MQRLGTIEPHWDVAMTRRCDSVSTAGSGMPTRRVGHPWHTRSIATAGLPIRSTIRALWTE